MGKGLFRRAVRRGLRSASSASTVRDASGKRYRVVQVDDEATKYADPPRNWPRAGVLAGTWAIALALGVWIAPAFAASGSDENTDPRDEAATDAEGAAWSYLRYGSNQDLDRAEAALCDGAEPELVPEDLDAIRQGYSEELGGITDIDLDTGDPVSVADGIEVAATVYYISGGTQRQESFTVIVQETGGAYCVSDATQPQSEEPSSEGTTGEEVDPHELALMFLSDIVGNRDPESAEAQQCSQFSGITAQDLASAIDDWEAANGWKAGRINSMDQAGSADSSVTAFEAEVELQGDLSVETFDFSVEIQGGCVVSLEGGDGLMDD